VGEIEEIGQIEEAGETGQTGASQRLISLWLKAGEADPISH
jgi:hypothetical protein